MWASYIHLWVLFVLNSNFQNGYDLNGTVIKNGPTYLIKLFRQSYDKHYRNSLVKYIALFSIKVPFKQ